MQMVCDEAAAWMDADDATSRRGTAGVHARVRTGAQHTKKGIKKQKKALDSLPVWLSLQRESVQA